MSDDCLTDLKFPRTIFQSRRQANESIRKFLENLREQASVGLHLGAGASKIPGLINCDLFNPEADLKVDSTNLETIEDGSMDLIETHHMIEHLSFEQTEKALSEWNRVLREGGLLILTCPDMLKISMDWIRYSFSYPFFPQPEKLDYIVKMIVGSQEHEGMFHRNAFDARRLSRILKQHGFEVEFSFSPYPLRTTPSLLVIARKTSKSTKVVLQ